MAAIEKRKPSEMNFRRLSCLLLVRPKVAHMKWRLSPCPGALNNVRVSTGYTLLYQQLIDFVTPCFHLFSILFFYLTSSIPLAPVYYIFHSLKNVYVFLQDSSTGKRISCIVFHFYSFISQPMLGAEHAPLVQSSGGRLE
ncbi:hypothetical protein [Pseudobacter ginsenosidimutans]|uniref:hypothetical protein n=1 Tax=Pseudobacter ginsenosidimutans TaxID=661488 RepID=UPI001A92D534|nr:hypothetical protein [Pseudobacter ginsenosidimutans]